jgi:probable addiction module antidote protein
MTGAGWRGGEPQIKTEPFDAARYIASEDAQAELLNDALDSGSTDYLAQALGVIARARGVTCEALCKSLSEDGDPRLTTLLGVLGPLGAKLHAEIKPVA